MVARLGYLGPMGYATVQSTRPIYEETVWHCWELLLMGFWAALEEQAQAAD